MPTRELRFERPDGVELHGTLHEPEHRSGDLVVVLLPALGTPARAYRFLAEALAKAGFTVLAVDLRGTGGSTPPPRRGLDWGFDDHLRQDLPTVVDGVRNASGCSQVVFAGHSYGGHLALAAAAERVCSPHAIVLLASASIARHAWGTHSAGVRLFTGAFARLARVLGYFPGHRLGWGSRIARQVILDWAAWCRTNRFRGTDGTDFEPGIAQLDLPVLAVSFSDDTLLGARSAADALAAMLQARTPERWHLTPADIGKESVGHFGFLRDAPAFWDQLAAWLHGLARDTAGASGSTSPQPGID